MGQGLRSDNQAAVMGTTTLAAGERARTRRRRATIIWITAATVVVVGFGLDAALGAAAQNRPSCRVVDGVTIEADINALPVTTGVLTGSIGTATATVPWDVMADRAVSGASPGALVSLRGEDGRVVVEASVRGLPATVTLLPEVTRDGEVVLSPTSLTVAGREVPLAVARSLGVADGLAESRILQGAQEFGPAYEVTAVSVTDAGLELGMRLPLSALSSTGESQECPGST